jgi:hypothetical protein
MKKCSICEIEKEINSFVKRKNRKSGYQPYCKDCHNKKARKNYSSTRMREYDLNKNYNITISDYDKLLKEQNSCCAICFIHIDSVNKKHKKNFCVDHCHDTGKIRGLLCDSCNRGIGLLKDNPIIINNAYNYLKRF